jgi:hypothetical protein
LRISCRPPPFSFHHPLPEKNHIVNLEDHQKRGFKAQICFTEKINEKMKKIKFSESIKASATTIHKNPIDGKKEK